MLDISNNYFFNRFSFCLNLDLFFKQIMDDPKNYVFHTSDGEYPCNLLVDMDKKHHSWITTLISFDLHWIIGYILVWFFEKKYENLVGFSIARLW